MMSTWALVIFVYYLNTGGDLEVSAKKYPAFNSLADCSDIARSVRVENTSKSIKLIQIECLRES